MRPPAWACGSIPTCRTPSGRCGTAPTAMSRPTPKWPPSPCCTAIVPRRDPAWSSWTRSTTRATDSRGARAFGRRSTRRSGAWGSAAPPSGPNPTSAFPSCPTRKMATRCPRSPTSPTPTGMRSPTGSCAPSSSRRTRAPRAGSMMRVRPSPPCSAAARNATRTRPGARPCHRPVAGCPTSSPPWTSASRRSAPRASTMRRASSSPTTRRLRARTPRSPHASPARSRRSCSPRTPTPRSGCRRSRRERPGWSCASG